MSEVEVIAEVGRYRSVACCNYFGSLAMLAAMAPASSGVSSLARAPAGLVLEIEIPSACPDRVADDESQASVSICHGGGERRHQGQARGGAQAAASRWSRAPFALAILASNRPDFFWDRSGWCGPDSLTSDPIGCARSMGEPRPTRLGGDASAYFAAKPLIFL